MKKAIFFVIVIVLIALGIWFFVFQKKGLNLEKDNTQNTTTDQSLGGTIYDNVGTVKPVENMPDVNVFNSVETNPYKQGYANPFE